MRRFGPLRCLTSVSTTVSTESAIKLDNFQNFVASVYHDNERRSTYQNVQYIIIKMCKLFFRSVSVKYEPTAIKIARHVSE